MGLYQDPPTLFFQVSLQILLRLPNCLAGPSFPGGCGDPIKANCALLQMFEWAVTSQGDWPV